MRMLCIFSFLSCLDTLFLYIGSCDCFYTYIVFIFLYMSMYVSFIYLYMCYFFYPFIHMFLINCMQSTISVSN